MAVRTPNMRNSFNSCLRWGAPAITGALLIASFPKTGLDWLAWIAFVPLIVFTLRANRVRTAFWGGFIAGFVELLGLLVWMPEVLMRYGELSALLAWTAFGALLACLACYPALVCALIKYVSRRRGEAWVLLFPAAWTASEYVQNFFPFGGFPWLTIGYSQSERLTLIQIADAVGVHGISFLVLCSSTALSWLVLRKGRTARAYAPAALAVLLTGATLWYGRVSLNRWETAGGRYGVAMLQGNLSAEEDESALRERFLHGYPRMAERLQAKSVDLLILPESPTPLSFDLDRGYRRVLEDLAGRFSLGVVFSNIKSLEANGTWEYFNSAYFLDNGGALRTVYDKMHLVPFGEYVPLKRLFFFIDAISKDVDAFNPGRERRLTRLDGRSANAIICFEAVFPGLVRQFVRDGSELIINLTNDAWYGKSAAPYQHLAIARLRAVENRRYLLRAANSGISAVIAPSGRIRNSTGLFQEAVCEGRFDFVSYRSLFTRYGEVLVFLCVMISAGSLLPTSFVRRRSGS